MKSLGSVALVVGALLIAGCSGESSPESTSSPTTVAAASTTTKPPSTAGPTTTKPPSATVPTTTTTVAAVSTTPTVIGDGEPMPGWDSWTLIFASLDTEEHSLGDAEVIASGIHDGAVLLSDNYPSLNPGYWVVYAGSWGDRQQASIWCRPNLDPAFTCYPRYLGPSIPGLLEGGAAMAQLDAGRLVALEPTTGEILATFSDNFHWEAEYPAQFNLTADSTELFFSLGWEDSWYWCESDRGQIRRLDLDSGIEDLVGDGWSPSISPDGRWLAIVAAAECYPDPEVAGWVVSPGSQVEIYDLTDADLVVDRILRTAGSPESYEDPRGVRRVTWDPGSEGDLLVWLADSSVRRVDFDSDGELSDAELVYASEVGDLAAVSPTHWYLVERDEDVTAVTVSPLTEEDLAETYEIDGWVTGFALGRAGDVIITTWEFLVLPSGERVAIDGGINNLAW